MSENSLSPAHPINWAFLGVGAAIWGIPLATILEWRIGDVWPHDSTLQIVALTASTSIVGIFLEQLLSPLDRWLPEWSRMPRGDRWAKAWQTRWRHTGCDAEFKRYEALVSFGRAYTFHFLSGTVLWPALLVRQDNSEMAVIAIVLGIVLTVMAFLGWRRQLRRIVTVVNSAAAWTPEASDVLSEIKS